MHCARLQRVAAHASHLFTRTANNKQLPWVDDRDVATRLRSHYLDGVEIESAYEAQRIVASTLLIHKLSATGRQTQCICDRPYAADPPCSNFTDTVARNY